MFTYFVKSNKTKEIKYRSSIDLVLTSLEGLPKVNRCIRGEPHTSWAEHLPIILVLNSTVKPTPEKNLGTKHVRIKRSIINTKNINDHSKTRFQWQLGNALQRSNSPPVDEREKILQVKAEQCFGTKTKEVGGLRRIKGWARLKECLTSYI